MAIYLIRHGETASNAARVLQHPETPLSERGLSQAARLGERLAGHAFAHILVSDYARAHQTAEAVSATTSTALEVTPLLRERSFGDLRGRPYAELAEEGIDPFAEGYAPPGGESWEQFHARVAQAWSHATDVAHTATGDVAVVTHGLVCHGVVGNHARLADGVGPIEGWTNTSVTVLEPGKPWTVTLLNCAEHLDDVRETGRA